jgi:hypothetical protein
MSDGDNFILGTKNSAGSETDLSVTLTGGGDGNGFPGGAYGLYVEVSAPSATALRGNCPTGFGVYGSSDNVGVFGVSTQGSGVRGTSFEGFGVEGSCFGNQSGVLGTCQGSGGFGVQGIGVVGATGVAGVTQGGVAVLGIAQEGGRAGGFIGDVDIQGDVIISGNGVRIIGSLDAGTVTAGTVNAGTVTANTLSASVKNFRIDHPLNPKNKFLVHASVESSEMKTFYDGVVTLDRSGKATVRLPKWFEALNKDFRYQLTPVGAPAPNLHIAEGVTRNRFKIAGGAPRMKVCWQVTGIRQDKFAKDHPLSVEQDKRTVEQDKRSEDIRDAQSRRQVEAFKRWLKEVQAKTQALMSAQSQRMEELRKTVQKKK